MPKLRDISNRKAKFILTALARSGFDYERTCDQNGLSIIMLKKLVNKYKNYYNTLMNRKNKIVAIDCADVSLEQLNEVVTADVIVDVHDKERIIDKAEEVKIFALERMKKLLEKEKDLRAVNETVKVLHFLTNEMYIRESINGNKGGKSNNFLKIIEKQLISNQDGVAK